MAVCKQCNKEMMNGPITCTANEIVKFPDGVTMPSIAHTSEHRCGDCNVTCDGNHHPGCDQERCPRCSGQLISCGCLDADEEDEENDDGFLYEDDPAIQ